MKEPQFRCPTAKSKGAITVALGFPSSDCQDWEWTIGTPGDIEKYINHYKTMNDEDQKFTLMEIIIQALTEQSDEDLFKKYWQEVSQLLETNFKIHEYSVYYWTYPGYAIADCWKITPYMRELAKPYR